MKKLMLGMLALVAVANFAGAQLPGEVLDSKFLALIEWSGVLNAGASEYNKVCSDNADTESCMQIRAVFVEQLKYFVECANRYSTGGTDCRAKLRPLIIEHTARLFQWNIDCVGHPTEAAQCGKEGEALAREKISLQKRIDQCEKETKNEKL